MADDSTVYRVAKWRETFETADSRKHKALYWISVPVGFGSNGYAQLIEDFGERAPAIYGAWVALANVAATCPIRGVLSTSGGEPLSVGRLAFLTRFPVEIFVELLAWASSPRVGWLEVLCRQDLQNMLTDSQSIGNRSTIELPNLTLPDLTQPNPTEPNPTKRNPGGSVGRSVEVGGVDGAGVGGESVGAVAGLRVLTTEELAGVDSEVLDDFWKRLVAAVGGKLTRAELKWVPRQAVAAGLRSPVLELARSIGDGKARSPRRYLLVGMRKLFEERGVALVVPKEVVR